MAGAARSEREPKLGAVEVLRLVDQQVPAAFAPRREDVCPGLEQAQRASHEVVEIEAAAAPDLRLVRGIRPRDRPGLRVALDRQGIDVEVELEAGKDRVEAAALCRASQTGTAARSTSSRSSSGSTGSPASRRISSPRAWNVRMRTRGARPASERLERRRTRSRSSSAARLLNVIAQISSGAAPSSISHAIRATRVVVLPEPAGATHRTGPGGAVAARRWSTWSFARRSATAGCWATTAAWRISLTCRQPVPVRQRPGMVRESTALCAVWC